jgi:2-octaprenyl-6-methoxyphenol hydroxylase
MTTKPFPARDADVMIAGGGMVGLTLALALDQAGLRVLVADAQTPQTTLAPHFDGRAFAIAFATFRMFKALGLGPDLEPVAQPIERIMVTDGRPLASGVKRGGPSLLHLQFDSAEIADGDGGEALGVMLENRYIRLALDKAVRERPGIQLVAPVSVSGFAADSGGVNVTLGDGRQLRAGLLVGADGRKSNIRAGAGIRTIGWPYPVTAIVCTVSHDLPHGGVAHEFFLPAGPFAILPLTGNRANIVWMEKHAVSQALLAMPEADFLAELKRRFGDFLGDVRLEGPRFGYPLSLQMAEKMIGPRLALAGDSAHGVHPIAGQGLNMGLKDVAALADVLADAAALGLDPGDPEPLKRYQAWRRADNFAMAFATDFFDRFFSNDEPRLRLVRGLGLGLVNQIGPARRFFMKYAGGGAGNLPRLLKGESLAA